MKRFLESIPLVCLVLALVLALLSGCGPFGQAFGQSMKQCELGQIPSTLQATIADVSAALTSGDWKSELEQLGVRVGVSQVDCIVSAVVDGLKAHLPAHGEADPAYLVAIQHGQLWLAGHGK